MVEMLPDQGTHKGCPYVFFSSSTTMLRISTALFILLSSSAIPQEKASDIDGTYELKELFENGKGSDEKGQTSTVTFKDGAMSVKLMMREDSAKFTVDTSKPPFQIDFKTATGEVKTVPGIWKVERGELTLVFNKKGARPADFRGLGEGVVKMVMVKAVVKKDK